MKTVLFAGVAAIALVASGAAEASLRFTVYTAIQNNPNNVNSNGAQFEALPGAPGFRFDRSIGATFDYTGPLNFVVGGPQNSTSAGDLNSTFFGANAAGISNFAPIDLANTSLGAPANANFSSLANFLASSGSASGYKYGSFYKIEMGTLAAGTILTIRHDDGVSVFQDGVRMGNTVAGPTTVRTSQVVLTDTADTILYYGRQNGAPSILQVTVPEPATLGLLGAGLLGLGFAARRRKAA